MRFFFLKKLSIALLLGFLGYAAIRLLVHGGFDFAFPNAELLTLGIILLTSMLAAFLAGPLAGLGGARAGYADDGYYDDGDREAGTVKWFSVRKGYGFITRDQGDDVFVHFRNIEGRNKKAIVEGQRVSFIVTMGQKGEQADQVTTL